MPPQVVQWSTKDTTCCGSALRLASADASPRDSRPRSPAVKRHLQHTTPDGIVFIDRVEIVFDAGHRILGHQGKCSSPHGHTYRAEVFVRADELDQLGFAIDFGSLKAPLKAWIDSHWDHAFLLNALDEQL